MIVTQQYLDNMELKLGKLSLERCKEIDSMPIEYPYDEIVSFHTKFLTKDVLNFTFTSDERIVFAEAFSPMPIVIRESEKAYPNVYLLVIDDEFYELIFDIDSVWRKSDRYYETIDELKYEHSRYILKKNKKLENRPDFDVIIKILKEIYPFRMNVRHQKNKRNNRETLDIIYEGVLY